MSVAQPGFRAPSAVRPDPASPRHGTLRRYWVGLLALLLASQALNAWLLLRVVRSGRGEPPAGQLLEGISLGFDVPAVSGAEVSMIAFERSPR